MQRIMGKWIEINNLKLPCFWMQNGNDSSSVILWGMYPHSGNELADLADRLQRLLPGTSFSVVAYQITDWNADFSPWKATAAFGSEDFAGHGPQTMDWIQEELIPWVKANISDNADIYLAGYSLAGLFSLWGMYQSSAFAGAACCSGSLWLDGWDDFARSHEIVGRKKIYLSLGTKEEKTKNQLMARVGARTREQEYLLQQDTNVRQVVLEWNNGGHFTDTSMRLAKGIAWLIQKETI